LEQADPTVGSAKGYLGAAVYLAAAEAHDLRYVTADSRLVRKVRDGNNRFQQMLVPLSDTP
jgi:hypothetical protein